MSDFISAYLPLFDHIMINVILAFSQYIVLRAGVFSAATAGIVSIGAYGAAIAAMTYGAHPALGALVGVVLGTATGALLSIPLARLRGVFQAIATIAFVQIVASLMLYAESITGGAMGLNAIPKHVGTLHIAAAMAVCIYLMHALGSSGIGRAFDAIRQDETVAVSLGISVTRYQAIAFAISGALAGLAGCLTAYHTRSLVPEQFGFGMVVAALAFVVLGGRISIAGPIVGAVFLTLLPELARPLGDHRMLVHGALLMLSIVYLQHGIADTLKMAWRTRRVAAGEAAAKARPVASEGVSP